MALDDLWHIPQKTDPVACPDCGKVVVYRVNDCAWVAVDRDDPRQQHPTSRTDGVGHLHAYHKVTE